MNEPNVVNIPAELRARPQWVAYQTKKKSSRKTDKIPVNARTGELADSTDADTWASFDEAVQYAMTHGLGIGYVFSQGDPYFGVDLDHCVTNDDIEPEAKKIIELFRQTYSEFSPSATGVHLIGRGKKPGDRCRNGKVEIYDCGRFFTITGHPLNPNWKIEDRQVELEQFYRQIFGKQKREEKNKGDGHHQAPSLDDDEILSKARNAANGAKFRALYDAGDFEGYASQSEADSALCMMLAFYCGKDETAIDRLFRQSGLMRDKWDSRRGESTYGAETIQHACSKLTETYQAPSAEPAQADEQFGTPIPEIGIIKRLADAILATDNFAQDSGQELYVFRNGVYVPRGSEFVRRRVKTLLEDWKQSKAWSSTRANEVAKYIRIDSPKLWDTPPTDAINIKNGLLNLKNSVLIEHSKEWLSSVQLPIKRDLQAKCHFWEKFISKVFPADAQKTAWHLLAWLMVPNTSIQKAVLLLGDGSNGKSRFLSGVTAFLGPSNVSGISLHRLEEDRFAVARLISKLANISADLPAEHLKGTSVFKNIVGGDRIPAERKYSESFEFTPFCRLLFSANTAPRSSDSSSGFFRKWLVIPFDYAFTPKSDEYLTSEEVDRRLADPKELSGVLNRAMAALPEISAGIPEPESLRRAAEEFRGTTDPFSVWLEAETISLPEVIGVKADLLQAYNKNCEKTDRPYVSANQFTRLLRRARPGIEEAQRTINGREKVWVWVGIALRETRYAG